MRSSRTFGIASTEGRRHPASAEDGNVRGASRGSDGRVVVLADCFDCRNRRAALGLRLESVGLASSDPKGDLRGAREANERRSSVTRRPSGLAQAIFAPGGEEGIIVDGRRSDPDRSSSLTRRRRKRIWLPGPSTLVVGETGRDRGRQRPCHELGSRSTKPRPSSVVRRGCRSQHPPGTNDAPAVSARGSPRTQHRGVVATPKLEARRQARLYSGGSPSASAKGERR
jgi:hypothetical protein